MAISFETADVWLDVLLVYNIAHFSIFHWAHIAIVKIPYATEKSINYNYTSHHKRCANNPERDHKHWITIFAVRWPTSINEYCAR